MRGWGLFLSDNQEPVQGARLGYQGRLTAFQFDRSAIIGSILEALRAGRYPARSATAPSRTTIPIKVSGSLGAVRNSNAAIRRETANDTTNPTEMPISASRIVLQITSSCTRVSVAP